MAKIATAHYCVYPQEAVKPLWAYAFRPLFILLPLYMCVSLLLWIVYLLGWLTLPFLTNSLHWHIYELLFGIGAAGVAAFLLTAVPEMFPGTIPITGKKLKAIVVLWLLGRVSFWLMDYTGIYLTALLNISLFVCLWGWAYRPIVNDRSRRHVSLLLVLGGLILCQMAYFLAIMNMIPLTGISLLYFAIGLYMVLILLVLRRVTMEVVNTFLEKMDSDEVYFSRPPRYNLAIFIILLYSLLEMFYPHNSVLGWLGLAAGAATLGILNDFILDDKKVLRKPLISLTLAIYLLIASGYLLIGLDYLYDGLYAINHLRHLLTSGAFTLSFYLVMVIVSNVHTGRELCADIWISLGGLMLILAAVLRASIAVYPEYVVFFYFLSGLFYCLPFLLYLARYYSCLTSPRVDGLPG